MINYNIIVCFTIVIVELRNEEGVNSIQESIPMPAMCSGLFNVCGRNSLSIALQLAIPYHSSRHLSHLHSHDFSIGRVCLQVQVMIATSTILIME